MNVVHVGTGYTSVTPHGARGPEKTIYFLVKYLSQLGCNVEVIDIGRESESSIEEGSVRFHGLNISQSLGLNLKYLFKTLVFSVRVIIILWRIMRRSEVNIVHTHSQFPAAAVLIARRLFRWKFPIVYTAHSPHLMIQLPFLDRLKHNPIEGRVMRSVDCVVALTTAVKNRLISYYKVKPYRVAVVSSGVNIAVIEKSIKEFESGCNIKTSTIICVGLINSRKNQLELIKCIPAVLKEYPNYKFIFAGAIEDTKYFNEIRNFVTENNITEQVDFLGEVPPGDLHELYQEASIMVFPTLYETQGFVLIEAMAFGLPVIASKIAPIEDVVNLEDGSAMLVEPNAEQLTGAILTLLGDSELMKTLSVKGKQLVFREFPWEKTAMNTLKLYETLLLCEVDPIVRTG